MGWGWGGCGVGGVGWGQVHTSNAQGRPAHPHPPTQLISASRHKKTFWKQLGENEYHIPNHSSPHGSRWGPDVAAMDPHGKDGHHISPWDPHGVPMSPLPPLDRHGDPHDTHGHRMGPHGPARGRSSGPFCVPANPPSIHVGPLGPDLAFSEGAGGARNFGDTWCHRPAAR